MAGAPQRPPQAPGGQERRGGKPASPAAPPPEAPAAKAKRSPMLPAVVVAVALLGAAFMLKGGGGGEPSQVATTPTSAAEEAVGNPSHVVKLDPVTLNLADGSLAKVGIAIELADELLLEEIGEDPGNFGSRALDEVIQVFGEHTADDLAATGGKAKIKEELTARVNEAYHGDVVAVYFTELVVP